MVSAITTWAVGVFANLRIEALQELATRKEKVFEIDFKFCIRGLEKLARAQELAAQGELKESHVLYTWAKNSSKYKLREVSSGDLFPSMELDEFVVLKDPRGFLQGQIEACREALGRFEDLTKAGITSLRSQARDFQAFTDPDSEDRRKRFDVDLRDWPHAEKFPRLPDWQTIAVSVWSPEWLQAMGTWNREDRELKISYPANILDPEAQINMAAVKFSTQQTIRHELQHMGQTYLTQVLKGQKTGPFLAGVPGSRIRTPQYTQRQDPGAGKEEERSKVLQDLKQRGISKPESLVFHAFDDEEFYTRLSDSIQDLRRHLSSLSGVVPAKRILDVFLGEKIRNTDPHYRNLRSVNPDEFLVHLQRLPEARGKWKHVVRELYKAVQDLL
jgi:hypothetical protein